MELYHIDVYMPLNILQGAKELEKKAARARLSIHTKEWLLGTASDDGLRLYKHRYTKKNLQDALLHIARTLPTPFEVGVENGKIFKYAVRQPLDEDNDITVVVGANGVVRTAWINSKGDQHWTLDVTKYVPAPRKCKH